MLVYKLIGRTAPFDWAQMPQDVDLGLYRTMESATAEKSIMEAKKSFSMDWARISIVPVKVLG